MDRGRGRRRRWCLRIRHSSHLTAPRSASAGTGRADGVVPVVDTGGGVVISDGVVVINGGGVTSGGVVVPGSVVPVSIGGV